MKHYFGVATIVLLTIFCSCKKTLEKDYLNPELSTQGNMGQLFSGMMLNNRIHSSYWDYYTFIMSATGVYSQYFAVSPSDQMYIANSNYTDSRWNDYYDGSIATGTTTVDYRYNGPGILSNYREMQRTYNALSSADQTNQFVILQLAKAIMYDQTAQVVDLWGDIPFSQANALNSGGSITQNAAFDDAASIYDTIINGLDALNSYLSTATISQSALGVLKSQDLIYKGDVTAWRRYVNSLRLRLLMRVSNVNESLAKTEVTKMLASPTQYPLLDDNKYNAQVNQSPTTLISDLSGALLNPYASNFLLDTLMQQNGDPRLQVFFSKTPKGLYGGFSPTVTASAFTQAVKDSLVSSIDSATFMYNYNVPGVLFNAAETNFLTAEAMERWGLGDASIPYANGITSSINFYYGINSSAIPNGRGWPTKTPPTAATIQSFLSNANIAYSGTSAVKLQKIYTQKWLNFFILQAGQGWAEIRRTGYPKLTYAVSTNNLAPLPPSRLLYPIAEQTYNAANYSKVSAKDTRATKIFWASN